MTAILHVTRDLPPATKGGISTAVHGLALAQAEAGHAISVVSFDGWRPRSRVGAPGTPPRVATEGPLQVLRVRGPSDLHTANVFAADAHPAVVHAHDGLLWALAARVREVHGVPAVLHVHVLQAAMNAVRGVTERTMSLDAQERALREADAIIAPSRAVAALLREAAPELAPRVAVCGLGHTAPAARAAAEPPTEPGPIVYVGRFDDVKGMADLVEALPRLLARFPAARAVLAGGLPDNPRGERRWRERYLERAGLGAGARTAFLGWLDPDALDALYRAAAVVLVPSRFETFGQVALEAMARGAAVVATRAGGLPELIEDGVTGRLVPVGDVDGLVAAVAELYADPQAARALGGRAAEASTRWRWPAAVAALDEVYAEAETVRRTPREMT